MSKWKIEFCLTCPDTEDGIGAEDIVMDILEKVVAGLDAEESDLAVYGLMLVPGTLELVKARILRCRAVVEDMRAFAVTEVKDAPAVVVGPKTHCEVCEGNRCRCKIGS